MYTIISNCGFAVDTLSNTAESETRGPEGPEALT